MLYFDRSSKCRLNTFQLYVINALTVTNYIKGTMNLVRFARNLKHRHYNLLGNQNAMLQLFSPKNKQTTKSIIKRNIFETR